MIETVIECVGCRDAELLGRRICASVVGAGLQPTLGKVVSASFQHIDRDHDVSILTAMIGPAGRWGGVEPRLKVSMMFMRPPQHGHGWVARSVAAVPSGGCGWCAVCTGATAAISSRIRSMGSVLVPLASRPQCLIRWNRLGRTWIRNRLMNSSGLSVMVL